jgi:hypothetical protein
VATQKSQLDAQLKMQLERQRLASQERIAMENIQSREETEGTRLGIEAARGVK